MGTSLNGLTPAGTYPGLIKTGDNAPIDGTLKTLSDGNGNNLPMSVSTTTINLTGTAQVGGVAIANTTQLAAKQDTLVSGTNIKTINGTSVLGSGNIVTPTTSPSGVAGAIQFSNGSAFASDASNLFWDDTNNRLGIGLNTPVAGPFQVKTTQSNANGSIIFTNNTTATILAATDTGSALTQLQFRASSYNFTDTAGMRIASTGYATTPTAMLQIVGSGSTSATSSLLVQNSSALEALKITDDGTSVFKSATGTLGQFNANGDLYFGVNNNAQMQVLNSSSAIVARSPKFWLRDDTGPLGQYYANFTGGQFAIGKSTTQAVASALIEMSSTTMGFLPPRMTTTQKNAIVTPAAGLVVYDSTTNKLCCYNGSTWNDLF